MKKKRKKQNQKLKRKRRLREKHKKRRKKDCMIGMPFMIAYQGDSAGKFYCNDLRNFVLNPIYGWVGGPAPLWRLKKYQEKTVLSIGMVDGKILVKEAPLHPSL